MPPCCSRRYFSAICQPATWGAPIRCGASPPGSLVDHGDPDLDEYLPLLQARSFHYTAAVGARRYTIYPLGAPIVAVPGVLLLRPLAAGLMNFAPGLWSRLTAVANARGCPAVQAEPIVALHSWTEHIIASAIVSLAAVVMFLIAVGDLSVPLAVAVALLFAFGTPAWSTASRSLWQHGPSMLLRALALLIQQRGWRLIWLGAALAFAYVVRPTNAIPTAAAGVWVLLIRPRDVGEFLAGAAVVLVAVYLVEIGNAPGLTNGGIREARDLAHPSFTAWRVQPATYYVRVRARNKCGDSRPSPETVVVVQ